MPPAGGEVGVGDGGCSVGVGDACALVGVGLGVAVAGAVKVQLGWVGVLVALVGVDNGGTIVSAAVSVGFASPTLFCSWEVKAQPRKTSDKTARTIKVRR